VAFSSLDSQKLCRFVVHLPVHGIAFMNHLTERNHSEGLRLSCAVERQRLFRVGLSSVTFTNTASMFHPAPLST
jgi:hypothetical protein